MHGLRRWLYQKGFIKRYVPPVFTICIGNLRVGGTGKTPHTLSVAENLHPLYKVAILSRGYGRKTKGFLEVLGNHRPEDVGDESLLLKQRLREKTRVFVQEKRKEGIQNILLRYPETKVVILDDAFQHLRVKASHYTLISEYDRPFFKDCLLPMGRLRESRASAKYSNDIIVSKSPENCNKKKIISKIKKYIPSKEIYFSSIKYSSYFCNYLSEKNDYSYFEKSNNYILTGIDNPHKFSNFLKNKNISHKNIYQKDHFHFTLHFLKKMIHDKAQETQYISTEKDWVKIKPLLREIDPKIAKNFWYLPIDIRWEETKFNGYLDNIKSEINLYYK